MENTLTGLFENLFKNNGKTRKNITVDRRYYEDEIASVKVDVDLEKENMAIELQRKTKLINELQRRQKCQEDDYKNREMQIKADLQRKQEQICKMGLKLEQYKQEENDNLRFFVSLERDRIVEKVLDEIKCSICEDVL